MTDQLSGDLRRPDRSIPGMALRMALGARSSDTRCQASRAPPGLPTDEPLGRWGCPGCVGKSVVVIDVKNDPAAGTSTPLRSSSISRLMAVRRVGEISGGG